MNDPGSAMPIEIGTAIGPPRRSTTRESDNGITAVRIIPAMMHRTGGHLDCLAIVAMGMTLLVAACARRYRQHHAAHATAAIIDGRHLLDPHRAVVGDLDAGAAAGAAADWRSTDAARPGVRGAVETPGSVSQTSIGSGIDIGGRNGRGYRPGGCHQRSGRSSPAGKRLRPAGHRGGLRAERRRRIRRPPVRPPVSKRRRREDSARR